MKIFIFLIIILSLGIISCDNVNYSKYTYYKSGKIKEKLIFPLKSDAAFLLNYKETLFYESGTPKCIFIKKDGKLNDNCYTFYSNGKIKNFTMYSKDTINGIDRWFSENGELVEESLYLKGCQIIKMKCYNDNSNTIQLFFSTINGENTEMGKLKFNKEGTIIKEKSYYCIANGKDSINEGDKYDLDIIIYTYNINTYIQEAVIGNFDKSFGVQDSSKYTFLKSSNNHLNYKFSPTKVGQNLIIGKIKVKSFKNSSNEIDRDFIFYKDFIVKPTR